MVFPPFNNNRMELYQRKKILSTDWVVPGLGGSELSVDERFLKILNDFESVYPPAQAAMHAADDDFESSIPRRSRPPVMKT